MTISTSFNPHTNDVTGVPVPGSKDRLVDFQNTPILEFDPAPTAILSPRAGKLYDPLPERLVLCFFLDVIRRLARQKTLVKIGHTASEAGRNYYYQLETPQDAVGVLHPGVGAPLAAGFMEEAIAGGARKIIACGGCGVLQKEIVAGHPVILQSAIRDEGTSYHYLPAGREIAASPSAVQALESTLKAHSIDYLLGKSWTTDAIYRETEGRRKLRLEDGCQVVEMEAAAFFAVAHFRGVEFGQLVYGGDLVVPEGWDKRAWFKRKKDRQLIFELAVEAVLRL